MGVATTTTQAQRKDISLVIEPFESRNFAGYAPRLDYRRQGQYAISLGIVDTRSANGNGRFRYVEARLVSTDYHLDG